MDYDEELEQLTQDCIDKTRHTMRFVRRYRLMFGEPCRMTVGSPRYRPVP